MYTFKDILVVRFTSRIVIDLPSNIDPVLTTFMIMLNEIELPPSAQA